MLPCSWWVAWSVPSSGEVPQRGELRLNPVPQDAFVGVSASSTLLAAAHCPTRLSFLVVRCGLKLSQTIAIRTLGGRRERR